MFKRMFKCAQFKSVQCKRWWAGLAMLSHVLLVSPAQAETFDLPTDGSTIVGTPRIVIPTQENTLPDIARQLDVGYHEITWANPGVDVWLPEKGVKVIVPTQYILPAKPWTGIVLNISQRRLFYFPAPAKGQPAKVITFPVSIAREGWATPLGSTKVVAKHKDPAWFVPKSIQAEHKAAGELEFPEYFPPGPNNPMGMLAIQLGFPGIFIHGTNRPWGVGMRTSHGCLHLYPEDAAVMFPLVSANMPVRVIDEPVAVGVLNGQLHLASYEPVAEYGTTHNLMTRAALALSPFLQSAVLPRPDPKANAGAAKKPAVTPVVYEIDWQKVEKIAQTYQVIPLSVDPQGASLEAVLDKVAPDLYDYPPYEMDANDASLPGQ